MYNAKEEKFRKWQRKISEGQKRRYAMKKIMSKLDDLEAEK